jgi:hypothetical protein
MPNKTCIHKSAKHAPEFKAWKESLTQVLSVWHCNGTYHQAWRFLPCEEYPRSQEQKRSDFYFSVIP